ncbi:MAG TPA: PPOX class F420-dependent oxidoreductase [Pseudonocardia sp.]|nr:PPOX class F420-dependent oxidoreductase [Pseudonocardia sp.]
MTIFSNAELAYLHEQRLARLATIGPDGAPQVRPVGFRVDPRTGAVDIAGRDNPATQKWRNIARDGRVSLVVDDVVPDPWQPRALEIRGTAELLPDELPDVAFPGAAPGVIRIHPRRILAFGIEAGAPPARTVPAPAGPA